MPLNQVIASPQGAVSAANLAVQQAKNSSGQTDLAAIFASVGTEFESMNQLIPHQLTSDVQMVEEIGQYIVESGGKRLRPLLVLLSAQSCGYDQDAQIKLAVVIEFLHTATLLHDDVVDRSALRRGRATANDLWGNAPSILVGDFLYSRAFQLMVEIGDLEVMAILSDATNTIAEGEVLQLAHVGNCQLTEAQYMEVIRCKSALLFQAACESAAALAKTSATTFETLKAFGCHFGLAYQLVDDWLDYVGNADVMGKNVGDDLAEGKLTLPLIYALQHADAASQQVITEAIQSRSNANLQNVIEIVAGCGALDYTQARATEQANLAFACAAQLPASPTATAMQELTQISVSRLS